MLVSKIKATAVILVAVGALTSGVGLCAYQDIGSGAAPKAVGSGSVPGMPPVKSQASGDRSRPDAKELDAYAALVEQLVRRARQEQAAGEWDGAARDLRKSVEVAGEWREALMNGRRSEKSTTLPPLPVAPVPLGAPLRIAGTTSSSEVAGPLVPGTSPTGMGGPPIAGTRLPLPGAPVPLGVRLRTDDITGSSNVPGPPIAGTSPGRSAECRLADLESKVDRILRALEKDGDDHWDRPKTALPYPRTN